VVTWLAENANNVLQRRQGLNSVDICCLIPSPSVSDLNIYVPQNVSLFKQYIFNEL